MEGVYFSVRLITLQSKQIQRLVNTEGDVDNGSKHLLEVDVTERSKHVSETDSTEDAVTFHATIMLDQNISLRLIPHKVHCLFSETSILVKTCL